MRVGNNPLGQRSLRAAAESSGAVGTGAVGAGGEAGAVRTCVRLINAPIQSPPAMTNAAGTIQSAKKRGMTHTPNRMTCQQAVHSSAIGQPILY